MRPLFTVLALFTLSLACAAEDVVTLKNGDRLTGEVSKLAFGKLLFKTSYAGEVLIAWDQVATLTTAGKIRVKLDDGQVIEGTVTTTPAGDLQIDDEALKAPAVVAPSRIAMINETPVEWHGAVDLGYYQSTGNTRKTNGVLTVNLLRESARDRFQIKADFRYSRESGVTTERKAYGLLRYNYKLTDRFFVYVTEELFHDFKRDLRIGTFTSVGAGLEVIKTEHTALSAEAGIAYATNDYRNNPDEGHLAGRVFVHFRQDLFLGLVFVNDLTYYPNFEHSTDWQLRDEAAISAGLGYGLTARVGLIWEYDHQPVPGLYRYDVMYFLTIGFAF